ncbi:MAG: hydroxyacid dehydrogenase [Deltaproteobacteria bacterium]|jgi:D-3-phosphoglycerate dehydrogenase|nr:hydroxyacid dehydrogenase [Deltaproteobacteria bacterium]
MRVVVGSSSFGQASALPGELLASRGMEVVPNPFGRKLTEDETLVFLQGADGLLAGLEPLNARVLAAHAGKLKAIARIGIGMDNVDQEAAARLGIAVSNTPDAPTGAVAEMTLAAVFALCRGLHTQNAALHAGTWKNVLGRSLRDLSFLIVGYGRIGKSVQAALKPFASEISVYDPFQPDISVKSLPDALAVADVVTLHASGREMIIDRENIKRMKPGAMLLNCGRGGQVDEEALAEALQSGHLSGCWLDVFSDEPYSGRLCQCETALLTPHASTCTEKCRGDMEMQAVRNILRDLHVE